MIILIHSSKTMRTSAKTNKDLARPELLPQAEMLGEYLKTLSPTQIAKVMAISKPLAEKTHTLLANWSAAPEHQSPAVDIFLGDIYSGLQVDAWSAADRYYANKTLRILSGLYGILRPLDGIAPYRLEMGYKLPAKKYSNLYAYWGQSIANTLPQDGLIVNVSAVEYSKTITPYVDATRIITPTFYTVSPTTGQPTFVTVHSKIARGAFASWLITNKVTKQADFAKFNSIGYKYYAKLSEPGAPAFVAQEFGGKGLSIRLT